MGYSYEDRVTWDELAPSVQALFENLQNGINGISGLSKLVPIVNNLVKLGQTTMTNNLIKLGANDVNANLLKLANTTITNNLYDLANKKADLQALIDRKTPLVTLADKKDDIINTINKFVPEAQYTYDPNKIAKTNSSGKLMLDNLLYELRAGGSAADINDLKKIQMKSSEIFNTWDRISHNNAVGADKNKQNLSTSGHVAARAAYYYDKGTDTICCTRNSDEWSAFMSKNTYGPSFKLGFSIPTNVQKTDDDDLICCVVAYMEDRNGCFHTIQVHRIGGAANQASQLFCLCYDIYSAFYASPTKGRSCSSTTNADSYILACVPPANLTPTTFNTRYCLVDIEKTSTSIKCYTSENVPYANRATAVADKGFTWTFPSTKPSDWPQAMYDNIKYMMQNPCKIGFGTESNQAAFKIIPDKCTIMDEIEIYDLTTGTIKYWDTSTNAWNTSKQKSITDAYIQPNSLIYSEYINKLFWFRRSNNFTEISVTALAEVLNNDDLADLIAKKPQLIELANKKDNIISLADKKTEILNTVNKFVPEAQYSYNPNKIAKTNSSGKLMLDNLLYELRAGATTADINKLKATKMNSGEIFSSWDRISHTSTVGANKAGQNLQNDDNIEARAAYYYDEATDTICCSRNSGPWSAFISKNTYGPSFKIGFSIPTNVQKTGDDDLVCCILSYMEDSNGCFHTIQVHRNGGISKNSDGSWCHSQLFCLCYDIYTSWYKSDSKGGRNSGGTDASTYILGYVPPANLTPTNFNDKYCLVNIEKTSTTIKCYTSENVAYADRATAVANKGFTWTMPTSKPSDWPQAMYDNIKYMMQNPCKIGFGTESNQAAFQIDPSRCTGILDEIEIYDLNRGRIQYWDTISNAWNTSKQKAITDEYIQPNSLIYSNIINKLFWFRRAGNYVELKTNG